MNSLQKNKLCSLIEEFSDKDGVHPTSVPGLHVIKLSGVNMRLPTVYNPSLCVIVQGGKQVLLEDEVYRYAPSQYLVVSVDLPVIGQVTKASEKEPYLCLQIDIDQRQIGELIVEAEQVVLAKTETGRGLFVGNVDESLSDCVLRLMSLLQKPRDIPLLAPMIKREIYYRLLNGEHGPKIAQISIAGSNMQRINTALKKIKNDYNQSLRVEDMAELAGMSVSSFHFHFKEVTAMSPLQYQKRLRLMEARRMMLTEDLDAASAAYKVGYESPSQFSREYSRMFGLPPGRDMESMRLSHAG